MVVSPPHTFTYSLQTPLPPSPPSLSGYLNIYIYICYNSKEQYVRIAEDPNFQVRLFGSWETEIGSLETATHIWEYNNYPGYIKTTDALRKDEV